jgi:hypothetical protein
VHLVGIPGPDDHDIRSIALWITKACNLGAWSLTSRRLGFTHTRAGASGSIPRSSGLFWLLVAVAFQSLILHIFPGQPATFLTPKGTIPSCQGPQAYVDPWTFRFKRRVHSE